MSVGLRVGVLALVLSGGFASYGVEIVSFQCWWAVSGGHYSLVLLVCLGSWGGGVVTVGEWLL